MTEDQAKTKWCPFARTGINADRSAVAVNRTVADIDKDDRSPYNIYSETRCIGSACMAWRGKESTGTDSGFCGLAGAR